VGKDPETARDSSPLKVIVSVPVEDASLPKGDLGPVLPEGVEDTNITGIPSAELTLLEPQKGLQTKNGKLKVAGTSDADSVTISFKWRGNADASKNAPPAKVLKVKDGVFRGSFQLPKGRWVVWASASIDGGYPAVEEVAVRSLNDKMKIEVEAVDGKTKVKLTKPNGDVIAEKVQLFDGQKRTWLVDPDVILRAANAKAAKVSVDGQDHGVMGKRAVPVEWRVKQGERPKVID
jgi:hypothetical protein